MTKFSSGKWIKSSVDYGEACPVFKKDFALKNSVQKAKLFISALGVYEAKLNGERIGEFVLAPGWTAYDKRVQYQEYDITSMIKQSNELSVTLGKGWCFGRLTWEPKRFYPYDSPAIICDVEITYTDGSVEHIYSDENFLAAKSQVLLSEIYDGETFDARIKPTDWERVSVCEYSKDMLIPQEVEITKETEEIKPIALIKTPKGETVIDFGQNLTGYVRFKPTGKNGDVLEISHAEILDKDGNFYTENLRSAKQKITYTCNGENDKYNPHFTFQGFRYIRLDKWSGEVDLNNFAAIVVHSDMKRTGNFECSNEKVNKLFNNIIWGQRGNFLDVPTDCPQRDERLGWTGDAQVFVRAASYNYDVEKFFGKWLKDLECNQFADGGVPAVIPNVLGLISACSSAWGDAAVICPWQIYLTYGNKGILEKQFNSMTRWVEYIRAQGDNEFIWNTGHHYGDWLGIDAPAGSYKGATDKNLIAMAYFAYSTQLLIKAGKVLGRDMAEYEELHKNIVSAFKETFIKDGALTSNTQTAHALTLYFGLCDNNEEIAKSLADLVISNGNKLTTGFVGTPYLLHALSDNGCEEVAYTLLLQEEFPSWLYSVNQGATTMWEHWDGINDKGEMWSKDMNSFNHYAYGAVADWMYGVMCGINTDESMSGFKHINFKPKFDERLDYAKASIKTRHGLVSAQWKRDGGVVEYSVSVPRGCTATLHLNGAKEEVGEGEHKRVL